MILTKDNLFRFCEEKGTVTPTMVSEVFTTTTLVASAALSQLVDKKLLNVTNIKLGSTPYYYPIKKKEILQDLVDKHLKGTDLEMYYKIKNEQVISNNQLSPAQKLAISKIKDFAIKTDIESDNKIITFWFWYLLDQGATIKQIKDVLKPKQSPAQTEKKETKSKEKKNIQPNPNIQQSIQNSTQHLVQQTKQTTLKNLDNTTNINTTPKIKKEPKIRTVKEVERSSEEEDIIENFLRNNKFSIVNKKRYDKYVKYELKLNASFKIIFDSIYFFKKITEADIINLYVDSTSPKIFFIKNPSNKIIKLEHSLKNLFIIAL